MNARTRAPAAARRFGHVTLTKNGRTDVTCFVGSMTCAAMPIRVANALAQPWIFPRWPSCGLTLGIGANAAVFSWIEGILLRPFPLVAEQDRLFAVGGTNPALRVSRVMTCHAGLAHLQRNSTLIDAFIADKITGTTLSIRRSRQTGAGQHRLGQTYFDALGVTPILDAASHRRRYGRNAIRHRH